MQARFMQKGLRFGFMALLISQFLGCASLPTDFEKTPSYALRDTGQTHLAQRVDPLLAANPDLSGFYALPKGIEALGARLRLVHLAETGIDLQYFIITDDIVGDLLIQALMEAADRGVRVRILLDDIETKGYELAFSVLSANPNIEIRLINPFSNRKVLAAAITEFQRVNHRMHNKSITFDNQATIVGGRNIGAPYFGSSDEFNYSDYDVLAIGPVTGQVSTEFDLYWNSDEAYPVTAFVEPDDSSESARTLMDRFRAARENAMTTEFVDAVENQIVDFVLASDSDYLTWTPGRVVYDLPYGTTAADGTEGEDVLGKILVDAIEDATEEFVLVSPYFVPGEAGMEGFRKLRGRGVNCVVLTNSLASTDQVAVYGGYEEYQEDLLEMGVELWELMAFPSIPGDQPGAPTDRRALHAKIYVLDNERLFVGSFNWDPRSFNINSEMGIVIESEEFVTETSNNIQSQLPGIAWKLRLDDNGKLEWVDVSGEAEVVYDSPPQSTAGQRFKSEVYGIDALEGQL